MLFAFLLFQFGLSAQFAVDVGDVDYGNGRVYIEASLMEVAPGGDSRELKKNTHEAFERTERVNGEISGEILSAYKIKDELLIRTVYTAESEGVTDTIGLGQFHLDEEMSAAVLAKVEKMDPKPFVVHETREVQNEEKVRKVEIQKVD